MTSSRCSPLRLMIWAASRAFVFAQFLQKDIGESQNRRHWGANLMAHVRQEFALGPVGGFGLAAGFFQSLIGLPQGFRRLLSDCSALILWVMSMQNATAYLSVPLRRRPT